MNSIESVQAIQNYIKAHIYDSDFSIDKLCSENGYTRRHTDRLFKKHFGKTLYEYITAVLLSNSARELLVENSTVLDIALKNHYKSHEGFTRSFENEFNITPREYRKSKIAIPLFVQHPITHYYKMLNSREDISMNDLSSCMITPIEKTERKLIYLPSKSAADYLSYCAEVGCQWEGLLNSIPEKLDTAAIITLPKSMIKNGYSNVCGGIEVPSDYHKPLPEGYFIEILPPCTMLYFQSDSFENEDDFGKAIESVFAAMKKYNPNRFGYKYDTENSLFFNFGADKNKGARIAVRATKL